MKIKICKVCKLRVDQCQCSNKIKEDWKKEQARILHERIADLDAEILRERELISHRKDMQEKIQRNRNALRYENNSFEIDDDIADVIFTLWEKGYDTRFCCSGHPENQDYGLYISFAQDYYFDFSHTDFDKGWVYTRYSGHCLRLNLTMKFREELVRDGIGISEYFLHQRELLKKWVQDLPPARLAHREESLPGLKISSSKIPSKAVNSGRKLGGFKK